MPKKIKKGIDILIKLIYNFNIRGRLAVKKGGNLWALV